MKYTFPYLINGSLAIEGLTLSQFMLLYEFIRICKKEGKWPDPDFGTPINPRIDELLNEMSKIVNNKEQ